MSNMVDQPSSSSSSSTIQLGGRAIDRHNPIIRDSRRTPKAFLIAPCASQTPPINPRPYHLLHKGSSTKKGSAHHSNKPNDHKQKTKKGSAKTTDDLQKSSSSSNSVAKDVFARKSWAEHSDFITPPSSSRYLLGDNSKRFFDGLSDYLDPVLAVVPVDSKKTQALNQDESSSASIPSSSARSERPSNQVVVLRVSLHCKGCEGKVRKHLSRMEGVTSFNIDFAAKKVTIVGDVTPLGVLASVSKVKNAQFWTPPTVVSNNIEAKK